MSNVHIASGELPFPPLLIGDYTFLTSIIGDFTFLTFFIGEYKERSSEQFNNHVYTYTYINPSSFG